MGTLTHIQTIEHTAPRYSPTIDLCNLSVRIGDVNLMFITKQLFYC